MPGKKPMSQAQKQYYADERVQIAAFIEQIRHAFTQHEAGKIPWNFIGHVLQKYWDGTDFGFHVTAGYEAKVQSKLAMLRSLHPNLDYWNSGGHMARKNQMFAAACAFVDGKDPNLEATGWPNFGKEVKPLTDPELEFNATENRLIDEFKQKMLEAFDKYEKGIEQWAWYYTGLVVECYWHGLSFGEHVVESRTLREKMIIDSLNARFNDDYYANDPVHQRVMAMNKALLAERDAKLNH